MAIGEIKTEEKVPDTPQMIPRVCLTIILGVGDVETDRDRLKENVGKFDVSS